MPAVMMDLKKELQALNVSISNDEVNAFRSCLCAMAARLQSEEASAALSLAEWWQWLDEEGYERELFATALRHICQSSLSGPAWTELQSDVHCMQARSEGLPELCQHVQERCKPLVGTMEHLEVCAQAEQHALKATAAGMSKKDAVITGVSAYVGIKVIAAISVGLILRRSRRVEVRIEEPLLEAVHQQEVAVEKKAVEAEKKEEMDVVKRVAEADQLLADAKRDEVEAMQTVTQDLRRQLREVKILGPDAMAQRSQRSYQKYSDEINKGFKDLDFPDGVKPLPICKFANEGEQYIVHKSGRDMVKLLIDGEIYHFYRSSGRAKKDPVDWPIKTWFPVNGIGPKEGWINKTTISARLGSQSEKIRKVQEALFLKHEQSIIARKLSGERIYLDKENEQLFIESVNEGLKNVVDNDGSNLTDKELLRKAFCQIISERNPKAYFVLKKERTLDSFIKENFWDPVERDPQLDPSWLLNNPDISNEELANKIRTEIVNNTIECNKKITRTQLKNLQIQAQAEIRFDSSRILDTKKIMKNADAKIKTIEQDWANRIIKAEGNKLNSYLHKIVEKKITSAIDQADSRAKASVIEEEGNAKSLIVREEIRVESAIERDEIELKRSLLDGEGFM